MHAAFALGAEGVQIGTRFVASRESSAHQAFKERLISSSEGDTKLVLKQLTPARLMNNQFFKKIEAAEARGAGVEELKEILGRARAKKGMFEGDMEEGELEIGQVSASIREILPAGEIVENIWREFRESVEALRSISF